MQSILLSSTKVLQHLRVLLVTRGTLHETLSSRLIVCSTM